MQFQEGGLDCASAWFGAITKCIILTNKALNTNLGSIANEGPGDGDNKAAR
jgi:hypothetical protein